MELPRIFPIFTVCLMISVSRIDGTFYMNDLCDNELQHMGDRLYSQYSKYYGDDLDCVLVMRAVHDYQRLFIDFDWIDLESHLSGCADYLEIYDGPDTSSPLIKRICGSYRPADLSSSGTTLTLRMVTDGSRRDKGFGLVFTSYHNIDNKHRCNSTSEFQCSNDQCIDAELECDKKHNCRDSSDEWGCPGTWLTVWAIIGIAIGALILVTCGVMLICACCGVLCFSCFGDKKSTDEPATIQESTSINMTTQPQATFMQPPPPYGQVTYDDSLPPKPQ